MITAVLFVVAAAVAVPAVTLRPSSAGQGDIVVIETALEPMAAYLEPGKAGRGLADERTGEGPPYRFFADGDRYVALIGIDAEAKPGKRRLRVHWPEADSVVALEVKTRKFPTESLKVEPKYVEPPPEVMARIAAEKERLDRLWRRASSERHWRRPFVRPLAEVPNSAFGLQRVFNGQRRSPHNGVDFKASAGVPVAAANAGEVVVAEDLYFTGNTVVLDHGLGLYTVYAHLSEIAVRLGEPVEAGRVVGSVGATGRATGPHLHWGARLMEARVDPMQLLQLGKEESDGRARR